MPKKKFVLVVPSSEEFRKTVEESEEKYGITDLIYKQCVEEFSRLDIGQLNKLHQVRIVVPFLLTWGQMTRVLGYSGVGAICRKLRVARVKIDPLRSESFLSNDFDSLRKPIVKLFDDMRRTGFRSDKGKSKQVGSVAASKILHLACLDLFVMWDKGIRIKGYQKHCGDGEEYVQFLVEMRSISTALDSTIKDLQSKYGKRVTRILDQYNWMKYTGK